MGQDRVRLEGEYDLGNAAELTALLTSALAGVVAELTVDDLKTAIDAELAKSKQPVKNH